MTETDTDTNTETKTETEIISTRHDHEAKCWGCGFRTVQMYRLDYEDEQYGVCGYCFVDWLESEVSDGNLTIIVQNGDDDSNSNSNTDHDCGCGCGTNT